MKALSKINLASIFESINIFYYSLARIKTYFFYRIFFGAIGRKTVIYKPLLIAHPEKIYIGSSVAIRNGARLEVILNLPSKNPKLVIGSNVNIEQYVHIVCGSNIFIGDNVSIAGCVAIVDVNHPYDDINNSTKVGNRIQCDGNYVEVGDGVFVGYGAIILPNVRIGRNSYIGAHSVVNKDIPAFSIAVGNPAKIVKKYNFITNQWEKV